MKNARSLYPDTHAETVSDAIETLDRVARAAGLLFLVIIGLSIVGHIVAYHTATQAQAIEKGDAPS